MSGMDLRREFDEKARERRWERRNKEYDDNMTRFHDTDMQRRTARSGLELQTLSDRGAMERSTLQEGTRNRELDLQYGPSGYYTEHNRIARLGMDRDFALGKERLKNEGYHYQPVSDAEGKESVNIYRRGQLMNPSEVFEDSDLEKLLAPSAPGGAPGQQAALPGQVPQAAPGRQSGGFVRRADGSVLSVDQGGKITTAHALGRRSVMAGAPNNAKPVISPLAVSAGIGRHTTAPPPARRIDATGNWDTPALSAPVQRKINLSFEDDVSARTPLEAIYGRQPVGESLLTKLQGVASKTQREDMPKFGEKPIEFYLRRSGLITSLGDAKRKADLLRRNNPGVDDEVIVAALGGNR